ncbi:lipopolysaccharide biosynthesis protein [Vibrio natriegens]|uniref:lipopolysaccharide biosynthesis protein n=1 Tax=Vibrio natriegens TaxID=691 RepID=UPI003DA16F61
MRYSKWLDAKIIKNYSFDNVFKKLKALIYHKLGDFFVNGTDNIIIAKVSSLAMLGYYSNYFLIISTATSVLSISSNAITANIGGLIEKRNSAKTDSQFIIHNLICSMMFMFVSVSFVINIDWFVVLWLGESFVIGGVTKVLMALNLLLVGMRIIPGVYKNAAGFFEQDKFAPILQGAINLLFSIILGYIYGVNGVLIGTLISSILVPFWVRPYILYKYLLKSKQSIYWLNKMLIFILFFIFIFLSGNYNLVNVIDALLFNTIILVVVLAISYFLLMYYRMGNNNEQSVS